MTPLAIGVNWQVLTNTQHLPRAITLPPCQQGKNEPPHRQNTQTFAQWHVAMPTSTSTENIEASDFVVVGSNPKACPPKE